MLIIEVLALSEIFKILAFVTRDELCQHYIKNRAILLFLNEILVAGGLLGSKIDSRPKYFVTPLYIPKITLYINNANSNIL